MPVSGYDAVFPRQIAGLNASLSSKCMYVIIIYMYMDAWMEIPGWAICVKDETLHCYLQYAVTQLASEICTNLYGFFIHNYIVFLCFLSMLPLTHSLYIVYFNFLKVFR